MDGSVTLPLSSNPNFNQCVLGDALVLCSLALKMVRANY